MAQQIIQQPDGRFALWSTIVDAIILYNCTEEEIIAEIAEQEQEKTAKRVREMIDEIKAGKNPYFQFKVSWKEAKKTIPKE
jgi:hypothetical protein